MSASADRTPHPARRNARHLLPQGEKGRRESLVFAYIARRIVYVIPIVISVALVCFLLVHITPGDPLVAVLPADASQELAAQLRIAYGFDRPLPVQFGLWLWRGPQGGIGGFPRAAPPPVAPGGRGGRQHPKLP